MELTPPARKQRLRDTCRLVILALVVGSNVTATEKVASKDGRIMLEDSAGHQSLLTQTGLDSDPWLSHDGQTVVFLRHSADDTFKTAVYEINIQTRNSRLLYAGPAEYTGRKGSYFGRPELDQSTGTLFLISKEYATEGSLLAVELATGRVILLSDHVVGYDLIACAVDKGDLIVLKRQEDILGHPYFLYWLYAPSGKALGLAGANELDADMDMLRAGNCPGPQQLTPTHSGGANSRVQGGTRVDGSVMERRLMTYVEPQYPQQAQLDGVQGDVALQVRVVADGTVQDINVISGPPQLIEAAVAAVKHWRYRPLMSSGRSVPVITTIKVPFRLPHANR
ncbi:MAG TPA: energy transducer TonB [Bryobacteraceae bacterium]|nr:energy transducer TonB [Bryobacteraceae bacterium]